VPKSPAPPIPVVFHELRDRLVQVLVSETPVRLVKAGKLNGLFTSPGGENKRLIEACVDSSPALLERVGSSGAADPKAQTVRLTTAGMGALAENLPIAELEHAAATAAGLYKNAFREACLRATACRVAAIRERHKQLIADNRLLLDVAQRAIKTQIAALEAERAAVDKLLNAVSAPPPSATLEPCRDRDYEFIQHAAGLLILEWRDSTQPLVREALEGIFASLGITSVGIVGELVGFDARCHDTTEDAEINSKVRVLQAGWQLKTHRGPLLLLKATVSPETATHVEE